jgi:hypothetical protein
MPRKSMAKADLVILADLVARYSLAEIMRRAVRLSAKKSPGRPGYTPEEQLGNDIFLWALVEIQRDGESRGAKKASEAISKHAGRQGLKVSSSCLAKAHTRVERIRKMNSAVEESVFGIKGAVRDIEELKIANGIPPLAPILGRKAH